MKVLEIAQPSPQNSHALKHCAATRTNGCFRSTMFKGVGCFALFFTSHLPAISLAPTIIGLQNKQMPQDGVNPKQQGLMPSSAKPSYASGSENAVRFGTSLNGFSPYFISRSMCFTASEIVQGRSFPFGANKQVCKRLINEVCTRMFRGNVPYQKGIAVEVLANRILKEVDTSIANANIQNPSRFLRQCLCAEAINAWVKGEFDGTPGTAPGAPAQSFKEWWDSMDPKAILNQDEAKPVVMCSTASNITVALAKALTKETGLDCKYISGYFRDLTSGLGPTGTSNHAWVCYVMEGGIEIPSDNVPTNSPKAERRTWKGKHGGLILCNAAWESFLAYHWGYQTVNGREWKYQPETQDLLTSLSRQKWSAVKVPWDPGYKALYQFLDSHPFGE